MRKECMFSEVGSYLNKCEKAGLEQMRESLLRELAGSSGGQRGFNAMEELSQNFNISQGINGPREKVSISRIFVCLIAFYVGSCKSRCFLH